MGKSRGSLTEKKGEDLRATWFHTRKDHNRCDVYFESVDGEA